MLPWKCGYCKSFLKKFWMSNTIGASERILVQWNLWRCKSKHYEQRANQDNSGKDKPRVFALQPVIFERPPLKEKDQQCGDIKDGNVEPIRGFAEYTIVGVEQHRDQNQAQQNFRQLDAPVVFLILEKQTLNQGKEEQGPEQQFHVLLGGFIYPGEGRNQDASACPIVQEVQDRASEGYRCESGCLPKN